MKPSLSMGLLLGGTLALSAFLMSQSIDNSLPLPEDEPQRRISPKLEELVPH